MAHLNQIQDEQARLAADFYITAIGEGKPREAVETYVGSNYIQHNLGVPTGIDSFVSVFTEFAKHARLDITAVRGFSDRNYSFLHIFQDWGDRGKWVTMDIFRFEDGKIVEHWDNMGEEEMRQPSGWSRTEIDGPTEVVDLEKTEAYKAIVRGLLQDVFIEGRMDALTQYISTDSYAQHHPEIGDGVRALQTWLDVMEQQGMPLEIQKLHRIHGQGNFVVALSEGQFQNQHVAFYDLFRLDQDKIVEHWDVIQPIPDQSTWQHDNGKF